MREFTLEDLTRYDGREGRPAYVAYEGKVYEVTESFLWQRGRHQALHGAGGISPRPSSEPPMARNC